MQCWSGLDIVLLHESVDEGAGFGICSGRAMADQIFEMSLPAGDIQDAVIAHSGQDETARGCAIGYHPGGHARAKGITDQREIGDLERIEHSAGI